MNTCRGCGKQIVWAVCDGKRIPLDPIPACYILLQEMDIHFPNNLKCERNKNAMVSHFITCPKRNEFSGSNKQKELI